MIARSVVTFAVLVLAAEGPRAGEAGRTFALLINGGGSAESNYLSHFHHLQDMVRELERRGLAPERISIFSSDGDKPDPDLASRAPRPAGAWFIAGTAPGNALLEPDLENSTWAGAKLLPAREKDLRKWFRGMRDELGPGDTLLLFVTDHGTRDPDDPENGFISLWNEKLSLLEFRALLAYLRPGVRVVNVMSQCYSGAFADAMTPLNAAVPSGDVCGFYSTTRDRPAYGCYPEGRDRDRLGHAFRFIDALGRHPSTDAAHDEVLIADTSPDVPVRTSDLFLAELLEDEAARRGVGVAAVVDDQLRAAWRQRARLEPQVRQLDRLGEIYGTFSPRTMAELTPKIEELSALANELETYEDRWKAALDGLRGENLQAFLDANPDWRARLDPKQIEGSSSERRKDTLAPLLPALAAFTTGRTEVQKRLDGLRRTHADASEARYRVDVRLASLLRMKLLLQRVAGTEMLRGAAGPTAPVGETTAGVAAAALAGLRACEASVLGRAAGIDAPAFVPEPLPPFEQDLATVRRVLPSWLGVRFNAISDAEREKRRMARGAVIVTHVFPDSAAEAAGIRPGDVIVGTPVLAFDEPRRIVEWTMTSPRDTPLDLDVVREDAPRRVTVSLGAYPARLPNLPGPLQVGAGAPPLAAVQIVGPEPDAARRLAGKRRMVFFWATWCEPCKQSIPDLLAWGAKTGVPVVAVTDEDEATIRGFLGQREEPFPAIVLSDGLRVDHLAYGVSGSPTFVLVDENDKIAWRKTGYSKREGFKAP